MICCVCLISYLTSNTSFMLILLKPFWLFFCRFSPHFDYFQPLLPCFYYFSAAFPLFLLFFSGFFPVVSLFLPPDTSLTRFCSVAANSEKTQSQWFPKRTLSLSKYQKSLITIAKLLNLSFWLLFFGLGGSRRTCKSYWTFLLNFIVIQL